MQTDMSETELAILAQLAEKPELRDTLEGVVDWWLVEERIRRAATRVSEALERLVLLGLILETRTPDGRKHYAVNQGRLAEIRETVQARRPSLPSGGARD